MSINIDLKSYVYKTKSDQTSKNYDERSQKSSSKISFLVSGITKPYPLRYISNQVPTACHLNSYGY